MKTTAPSRQRTSWRRICASGFLILALAYGLLLIPARPPVTPAGAGKRPFLWRQDQVWYDLQHQFLKARRTGEAALNQRIDGLLANASQLLAELVTNRCGPEDKRFARLETNLFDLAPLIAACAGRLPEYRTLVTQTRRQTKMQSAQWDLGSDNARATLYRLQFGGRMALEEVLIQAQPPGDALADCDPELSQTRSTEIRGVQVHSGDILVSRGGAPTSALISRGNDYPGNFSHAALVYVDPQSGHASVIESLIERGVVISSLTNYLSDKRLRLMVLRLRCDLPALRADPLLPHKAAANALEQARRGHIPYDFAMDHRDHARQFCSEVVSAAYDGFGIRLWMGMTHISSPQLTAWLGSLGVRHFETQEPADLEYDPQLRVVAEWRETLALQQAHIDDAVLDVLLEQAKPQPLDYEWVKLPLARAAKAYSVLLNWCGRSGPIPEGMSATTALRVARFRSRHAAMKQDLLLRVASFRDQLHYFPPYWELLRLAREAKGELHPPG